MSPIFASNKRNCSELISYYSPFSEHCFQQSYEKRSYWKFHQNVIAKLEQHSLQMHCFSSFSRFNSVLIELPTNLKRSVNGTILKVRHSGRVGGVYKNVTPGWGDVLTCFSALMRFWYNYNKQKNHPRCHLCIRDSYITGSKLLLFRHVAKIVWGGGGGGRRLEKTWQSVKRGEGVKKCHFCMTPSVCCFKIYFAVLWSKALTLINQKCKYSDKQLWRE